MKYASITITLFMVWLAVILMATLTEASDQIFQLFMMVVGFTLVMFAIGFGKVK